MRREEDRGAGLSEDRSGSDECLGLCPLDIEFHHLRSWDDPISYKIVERGRADIYRPGGLEPTEVASCSLVEAPDACSIRNGGLEGRDVGDVVSER